MDIPIDPELDAFIQRKLSSGQYGSVAEIVDGALRLMKDLDELPPEADLDELRRELQEASDQLDRGEGEEWNLADAQARLLERLAARRRVN